VSATAVPRDLWLWFDHHEGNLQELEYRRIDPKSIPGRFALKPSCSRVVYEHFSEQGSRFPTSYGRRRADVIDSFGTSRWRIGAGRPRQDDRFHPEDRFPSPRISPPNEEPRPAASGSPPRGSGRPPVVQKRLREYREEEGQMLGSSVSHPLSLSRIRGGSLSSSISHLTGGGPPDQNLAFLIYPETLSVLEVYN